MYLLEWRYCFKYFYLIKKWDAPSANRDKKAAKRFLIKVIKGKYNQQPRVINVDKSPTYPTAFEELKNEDILNSECELRQKKYLNNIIEQDHRFPKKLAKYKSYFQFFHTAWRTQSRI